MSRSRSIILLGAVALAIWLVTASPFTSKPTAWKAEEDPDLPYPAGSIPSLFMRQDEPAAEQVDESPCELVAEDSDPAGATAFRRRGRAAAAVAAWLELVFQHLDQNGDGLLNEDELPASLRKQLQLWDSNHDGLMDLQEFQRYAGRYLEQFLTNHNITENTPTGDSIAPWIAEDSALDPEWQLALRSDPSVLPMLRRWIQEGASAANLGNAIGMSGQPMQVTRGQSGAPGLGAAGRSRWYDPLGVPGLALVSTKTRNPGQTGQRNLENGSHPQGVGGASKQTVAARPYQVRAATSQPQAPAKSATTATSSQPPAAATSSAPTGPASLDQLAVTPLPITGSANDYWTERELVNEMRLLLGPAPMVFLGDSITDWFATGAGLPVWNTFLEPMGAANFGVEGLTTSQVLWQVRTGQVLALEPNVVVLMIGTNNLTLGQSPKAVADGISVIVDELRLQLPQTKILLLGILPRGRTAADPLRPALAKVNAAISQLDDGQQVRFLDMGSLFLQPDGTLPEAVSIDSLHPTELGYEIWTTAMLQPLSQLISGR